MQVGFTRQRIRYSVEHSSGAHSVRARATGRTGLTHLRLRRRDRMVRRLLRVRGV